MSRRRARASGLPQLLRRRSRTARERPWRSWLRIGSTRLVMLFRVSRDTSVHTTRIGKGGVHIQSKAAPRTRPPLLEAVIMAEEPSVAARKASSSARVRSMGDCCWRSGMERPASPNFFPLPTSALGTYHLYAERSTEYGVQATKLRYKGTSNAATCC